MIANSKAIKHVIGLALLLALPALAQPGHPEDAAFLAARDAFAAGERAKLERAAARLTTHPLAPWAEHFRLVLRLEDGSDADVDAFITRHEGTYLAEKMRGSWLKWLVRKQDWERAGAQFALLRKPDAETNCLGLEARLRLGKTEALTDARTLLASTAPLAETCKAPLGRLAAAGELPVAEVRARLRQQLAQGRLKEARLLAAWLPGHEAPAWRSVEGIIDHPARYLAKLAGDFAASQRDRELAMFAVLRMAKSDARVAAARWADIEGRFDAAERGFVWGRLALKTAVDHQPEATEWFDRAAELGAAFDEEQMAWRVRAALRMKKWPAVARAIDAMPEQMAALPEWAYWRGRAYAAAGEPDAARAAHTRIAGQPTFYGILATEALGKTYAPPRRAAAPTDDELAAVGALPGLQRGIALIRADLRTDGVREWIWALAGMNDRQLLAAAEYARRHEIIDRAINTADRTQAEHDFTQRYPTPFLDQVQPRVQQVGLDSAWVYGLMRQESRFIMDAKSSAGAKGLMQLMPATAKWVANKIGMDRYHPGRVTDMDTNVTLGTNYLKMVLDGLDNHPVLASAAYNAGPGRARKWRAERPLEGAIYAETIPFNETRDYVKKVMANATIYATLLTGAAPALTTRLGTIRQRGFGDSTAEDLP